jgi:ATP-dependent 26S proteasome regulatory subunit
MQDYLSTSILVGTINKINSGYIILDFIYIILILLSVNIFTHQQFKNTFYNKYRYLLNFFDTRNYVTIKCEDKNLSTRFKAIMHYTNTNTNNKSINGIIENIQMKWSTKTNNFEEEKQTTWKINQLDKFKISDMIEGKIYYYTKEQQDNGNNKMVYVDITELVLFSKKLSIKQLTEWIEERRHEYEIFLKSKILDKQYIIDITYNTTINDIEYLYTPWSSNVTFDNRFFSNKNEIVKNIKFFINNSKWYEERGIPYTLGILLWGEPGCGKTGFIKSIMNLTKRHGINIKLNNKFNMDSLKDIIYDEEIGPDLIIPQNKRILIFEDIDCMSDIVKDRDIKEQEPVVEIKPKKEKKECKNENNNLSYLLNIMDGLHECPGRIIIMTTNKPEVLDKALIRPGRIDYKIQFTKATIDDIKNILNFYWSTEYDLYKIDKDINLKYSHAEIVNFCRSSKTLIETLCKL